MNHHDTDRSSRHARLSAAALMASLGVFWTLPRVQAADRAVMTAPRVTTQAVAGPYHVLFALGPMEKMYTPAQVKALHPRDGEVILSGRMATMSSENGMRAPHHLELHVFTQPGDQVVTTAHVTIILTDVRTKVTTRVPIMTMQGVTAGRADFHYGNVVMLVTARYRVDITINGVPLHVTVAWQEQGAGMRM